MNPRTIAQRVAFATPLHLATFALFAAVLLTILIPHSFAQESAPSRNLEIERVIAAQVGAFRADDGEAAFSYAAPNIQAIFRSPTRFLMMVKRSYGMIYDPTEYGFEDIRRSDGKTIQPVIFAGQDRQPVRALYEMQQIDGAWLIAGVFLEAIEDQLT